MDIDIEAWSKQIQEMLHISHHIPGRIRLKFNNKLVALLSKSKLAQFDRYCTAQGPLFNYELNSATASLLIEYDETVVKPIVLDNLFNKEQAVSHQALMDLITLSQSYI